jgi:hypothetical protein
MKVTFIFTDTPDLQVLSHEDQYKSHFEFPDAALKMADCKERIVTIAELVGQLSHAVVHFTCKELDLKSLDLPRFSGGKKVRQGKLNRGEKNGTETKEVYGRIQA